MAPSPEVFPGGSWERPWTAGEDGEELVLPYEAGGAHATVEGEGELAIELDGEALEPVRVARRRPSTTSPSTAGTRPTRSCSAPRPACGSGR